MSIDNNTPSSPPASVPSEKLGSPLSSVASDSTPTTLMHQDAVTTANTVTPSQGNNGTSTLPSHTAILAEDAMPPQQHTALDPSQHPTFDNMDVDMVDANAQQLASADNASHLQELQSTANELTKQMSVASAKLPFLHGESRRVAVQEIQDLALTIKASNDLLVSFASMNQPGLSNSDAAASLSPTVLSPNNLPYFQWEGAVFDARHPWSVDVDACLTNFEDVMCFYRIDFDKEFRRLVPPMLSPTQRTWYQSFLSSHEKPTWMDFKSNFKARYGISVLDDRQKCAAALMNISFNPNESLASVVDRFNDLRRRAFDQLPQPFLLVSRLMLILPSALRSKINIIRQSKGLTNVTPNAFINIAKELLANMTQSEVDETMGHTAPVSSASVTTLPSTMASKWASNPVSNAIIPIQHGSTSKIVKPVAPPVGRGQSTSHNSNNSYPSTGSTAKKYCSYHKSRAHNTNECNAYAAVLAANNVADHSARPPLPCPDCDSPNYVEGHQCSTASRNGPPPSAPEHRFRMMQIAEPSTTVVNALTTTPSAPPKRYCTFHKSNKHSTNNCRAFAEHLQALESEISSNSHQSAPARALAHVSAPSASLTASPATTKVDDDLNNDSMDVDAIIASAAQR